MRSVSWQGVSQQSRLGADRPSDAPPGVAADDASGAVHWTASGTARSQPARHLDGLVAFGAQQGGGVDVSWQLSAAVDWQAERLDVRVVGTDTAGRRWNRTLLLERSGSGWRSGAWAGRRDVGGGDVPGRAPGLPGGRIEQPVADVVLDSCPLSHWSPVRRLGLAGPRPTGRRGGPVRPLAAAYPVLRVRLPDLAVVVTRQRYVGLREGGGERTLEQSFAGAPAVPRVVDDGGVPLLFEGLARRHDTAMVA